MSFDEIIGQWNYGSLPPNIIIGRDCFLERKEIFNRFRSIRQPGLILGDGVSVYTWTTFNVDPEGLLEIGDHSVVVGAVFMCAEHIRIGRRVVISHNVTLADSDFHPRDPDDRIADAIANAPENRGARRPRIVTRPITVDDDVWIGIGAIILKGVHIGAGARIEPGAIVTRSIPAGCIASGNPAAVRTE